jgi:hypothetical protein
MANIVITSSTNLVKVDWGIYATSFSKESWHKSSLHLFLNNGNNYVQVSEDNGTGIALTYIATTNAFIVDSVDGVAPTSNSDLYDKLITLIA